MAPGGDGEPDDAHGLEIDLLGTVRASLGGRELDLGGVKIKSLLVVLVLHPGQTLPKDTVITALWDNDPPLTADNLVGDYLSRLRTALAPARDQITLRAMRPGFRAELDPLRVDAHKLRDLIRRAERDRAAGDDEHAATLLQQALDLWPTDTPALADLESAWLRGEARRLRGWRLDTLEHLARLHLDAGHPERATALLRDVNPSLERENLAAAMILALHANGESTRAAGLARAANETLLKKNKPAGPALRAALDAVLGLQHSSPPRGPRQLPTDTTLFTGRGNELGRLLALAEQAGSGDSPGTVVISAIDGMGGVGKTALAIHAGHRLAERYPDGQLFLDLYGFTEGTPRRDPGDALAVLLSSLGVPPQQIPADLDARAAFYRDRVAGTRTLILLDNAADEAQVALLLPASDTCLVLVTSRTRFKTLDDALPLSLDVLPRGEAVALLRKAARRTLESAETLLLERIAELCGHLPLALKIAAAILRTGGRAWSLERLIERFTARRPGDELAEYTDETRSLTSVFDLSYQHLPEDLQRFFRRIGLLPGPEIDAYAAAALLDADPPTADRLLARLADHSLLEPAAPGRYRPHDLIRAHARTQAAAQDSATDRQAAQDRLLHYYAHTAHNASIPLARHPRPAVYGPAPAHAPVLPGADAARAWLRTERENLEAACAHAQTCALHEHVLALAGGLAEILRSDGPLTRALELHQAAAETAERHGRPAAHANALLDLGTARRMTGDLPGALETHTRALEIHRETGDLNGQANALALLGAERSMTGDLAGCAEAHTQALEIYRESGHRNGEAAVLTYLGSVRHLTGNLPGAAEALTQALEIYRESGHRNGEAAALGELGYVRQFTGDLPGAAECLTRALEIYRETGDLNYQATALNLLGIVLLRAGDISGAEDAQTQAMEIFRELGHRNGEAGALAELGRVRQKAGDLTGAAEAISQALDVFRETGNRNNEACVLNYYAATVLAAGDLPRALTLYQQALAMNRDLNKPDDEAISLEGIGEHHLATGGPGQGAEFLRQALEIYQRLGMRPDIDRVQARLAEIAPQ
jgi:tetratricopeptide (TPR) repeat protein